MSQVMISTAYPSHQGYSTYDGQRERGVECTVEGLELVVPNIGGDKPLRFSENFSTELFERPSVHGCVSSRIGSEPWRTPSQMFSSQSEGSGTCH
jgi:hypothetical protein